MRIKKKGKEQRIKRTKRSLERIEEEQKILEDTRRKNRRY